MKERQPRSNRRLNYWGPIWPDNLRVVPWPAPEYPTADTYRIRVDSEEYTCDNQGE